MTRERDRGRTLTRTPVTSPRAMHAKPPDPRARSTTTQRMSKTRSHRAELRPRHTSGVVHHAMQSTPSSPRSIARKRRYAGPQGEEHVLPTRSSCRRRPASRHTRRGGDTGRAHRRLQDTQDVCGTDPVSANAVFGRVPVGGRARGAGGLRELQGARRDARWDATRRRRGTEGGARHAPPRELRDQRSARRASTSYGVVSAAG